jgi:hypothetical protein
MRKPVRIDAALTAELNLRMAERLIAVPGGYKLYVTKTRCGRHSHKNKNITVPVWAMELLQRDKEIHCNDKEYAIYYACHEIAHIMSTESRVHGVMHSPEFYEAFRAICPARLQYFEIGYKPTLAAAAGITR